MGVSVTDDAWAVDEDEMPFFVFFHSVISNTLATFLELRWAMLFSVKWLNDSMHVCNSFFNTGFDGELARKAVVHYLSDVNIKSLDNFYYRSDIGCLYEGNDLV